MFLFHSSDPIARSNENVSFLAFPLAPLEFSSQIKSSLVSLLFFVYFAPKFYGFFIRIVTPIAYCVSARKERAKNDILEYFTGDSWFSSFCFLFKAEDRRETKWNMEARINVEQFGVTLYVLNSTDNFLVQLLGLALPIQSKVNRQNNKVLWKAAELKWSYCSNVWYDRFFKW